MATATTQITPDVHRQRQVYTRLIHEIAGGETCPAGMSDIALVVGKSDDEIRRDVDKIRAVRTAQLIIGKSDGVSATVAEATLIRAKCFGSVDKLRKFAGLVREWKATAIRLEQVKQAIDEFDHPAAGPMRLGISLEAAEAERHDKKKQREKLDRELSQAREAERTALYVRNDAMNKFTTNIDLFADNQPGNQQ